MLTGTEQNPLLLSDENHSRPPASSPLKGDQMVAYAACKGIPCPQYHALDIGAGPAGDSGIAMDNFGADLTFFAEI